MQLQTGEGWLDVPEYLCIHTEPTTRSHLTSKAFFIQRATAGAPLCATEDKLNAEQLSYAEAKGLRC